VIAMGIVHAERIDQALRRALVGRLDVHAFFRESAAEPFFVKNLERVQGDERDAVILSIGYGKNAAGKLLYRFGPLLLAGGERRLNVAVTRARQRMTIVSSFGASELLPERSPARGVHLLREYLRYAESGGADLGAAAVDKPALDAFEADVLHWLSDAGLPVSARHGVAGHFIDFAAAHPSRAGEMVLAIETDGPGYRAANTARDRDRLRQEHLQRLGWRFHRIWSSDWYTDPQQEVARVQQAYGAAVADADAAHQALADPGPVGQGADVERLVVPHTTARAARPPVPAGRPIAEYSHAELVAVIRWIESDTLLRTEEEMLDEVVRELGFSRRGSRIRVAVAAALDTARSEQRTPR
jgi:very-short-patch-repair endonuclease